MSVQGLNVRMIWLNKRSCHHFNVFAKQPTYGKPPAVKKKKIQLNLI